MMLVAARLVLAFAGAIIVLVGLSEAVTDGERFLGLVTVTIGGGILIAMLYERLRYRSGPAEARNEPAGPGGGEPAGSVPIGFRPTNEVFVDPSSGQRMRVYLQPATGNRRYLAEGLAQPGDHV